MDTQQARPILVNRTNIFYFLFHVLSDTLPPTLHNFLFPKVNAMPTWWFRLTMKDACFHTFKGNARHTLHGWSQWWFIFPFHKWIVTQTNTNELQTWAYFQLNGQCILSNAWTFNLIGPCNCLRPSLQMTFVAKRHLKPSSRFVASKIVTFNYKAVVNHSKNQPQSSNVALALWQ